jgi:hypothetical protein
VLSCQFNATSPVNCICNPGLFVDQSCGYVRCIGGVAPGVGCPAHSHVDESDCSAAPHVTCAANVGPGCSFHCAKSLCGGAVTLTLHNFSAGRANSVTAVATYSRPTLDLSMRGITSIHETALSCWPAGTTATCTSTLGSTLCGVILDHNPLGSLPSGLAFRGKDPNTTIGFISMVNCSITALPPSAFSEIYSGPSIYLGHNLITSLPDTLFDNLPLQGQFGL